MFLKIAAFLAKEGIGVMSKSEERCQNCQVSALEERVSLYHGEQTVFEKKADHCARDSNQRSVWMRKFSLFDGLSRKINP